jgi:hypothetical protein
VQYLDDFKPSLACQLAVVAAMGLSGCGGGAEMNSADSPSTTSSDALETAKAVATGGWSGIATEGKSFTVQGAQLVRFGAASTWIEKTVSGTVPCTNAFFGKDPAYGTLKRCEIKTVDASPVPADAWTKIADEWQAFSLDQAKRVRFGSGSQWIEKTVSSGQCTNDFFGRDPIYGVFKQCEVIDTAPAPAPPPAPAPTGQPSFTQAQFEQAIAFDFEGENGKVPGNPSAGSVGYPCGVPNSYSWKFGGGGVINPQNGIVGRGPQNAGAGYNQVYNACATASPRKLVPNARIVFTDMVVQYYSTSQSKWITAVKQAVGGAAFAEDFVNNEATGADYRVEPNNYRSVRTGIGNAGPTNVGAAGGRVPSLRNVEDSQVGYNFHGFPDRFAINWADAKAVIVSQAMRCIPNAGTDLGDCNKLGYIANVGLDSWASTTSNFDGFATHGGVSGGIFKPVTTSWQVFTSYIGPKDFSGLTAPSAPQF